mgnify:CR=1 FL=1
MAFRHKKMDQNIKHCPNCQLILQGFFNNWISIKIALKQSTMSKLKIFIQGFTNYSQYFYKIIFNVKL